MNFSINQFLTELKRRELRTAQTVPKYRYERVNYIVKKLLTVDYYLTIEDLVDELYISRSTLTADLKEVREIFKDYNLELISPAELWNIVSRGGNCQTAVHRRIFLSRQCLDRLFCG